ncbi:hypothetical protein K0U07_02650 [bacterium]|nr:hypothetical protein [bacterium]
MAPVVYAVVKEAINLRNDGDWFDSLRESDNRTRDLRKVLPLCAWIAVHALVGVVQSMALATRGSANITASRLGKMAPFFGVACIATTIYWAWTDHKPSESHQQHVN